MRAGEHARPDHFDFEVIDIATAIETVKRRKAKEGDVAPAIQPLLNGMSPLCAHVNLKVLRRVDSRCVNAWPSFHTAIYKYRR